MKKSVILLYVGAACCMIPGASAWNGGIPRSFVRGDASPKAASMARSGSPTMPVMSLGDDGFGRRDALSAMLASATLLSLGGPAAAKDVGDGGLPAGLKEYFDMLQTKKQVKTLAEPGRTPPLLLSLCRHFSLPRPSPTGASASPVVLADGKPRDEESWTFLCLRGPLAKCQSEAGGRAMFATCRAVDARCGE